MSQGEMVKKDDFTLQQEFLDVYSRRGATDTPARLCNIIGAKYSQSIKWIKDPSFRKEMEEIDEQRVFMAKEQIFRRLPTIIDRLCNLASDEEKHANALKAAELLVKIAGLIKTTPGADRTTSVTVNNLVQENIQGLSLKELEAKKVEVANLLHAVSRAEPGVFEEETS